MFFYIRNYLLNDNVRPNTRRRQTILSLVIISIFTLFAFSNIFGNSFVIDDTQVFLNWPAVKNMDIPKLLAGSYPPQFQGKAYRPIKGVISAIDYKIWGENPLGYHIQSIFLHLSITLLIFFLIRTITKKSSIAFVASLLFGIHPVHTEAITFMSASLDTWGILFFFLSFYFYLRSSLIASLFFAFLAFFTYELTLTLPILIIIYDFCFKKINRQNIKEKLITYFCYFFLLTIFFLLRFHFIGLLTQGGYFAGSFYLTMLTLIKAVTKYLELLIFPVNLSINPILSGGIESFVGNLANFDSIKAQSISDPDILLSIVIIVLLITLALSNLRKKPIISFSLLFIFIALVPVVFRIPQQVIMAERYLYISSFGFVLILGLLFERIARINFAKTQNSKLKTQNYSSKFKIFNFKFQFLTFNFALLALVLFYSYLTMQRNRDWKDDLSVWKSLSEQPATNEIKNYYLGMFSFQKGDYDKAIAEFNKAIDKKHNYMSAYYYLSLSYLNQRNYAMAKKTYDRLAAIKPLDKTIEDLGRIIEANNPANSYKN